MKCNPWRGLPLAVLAALGCWCAPAGAERLFAVELIVFRNLSVPPSGETVPAAGELMLTDETAPVAAFDRLPQSERTLRRFYDELRQSSRYAPIVHLGWIQPGLSEGEARAVGVNGAGLSGTATVSLARYLDLDLDLTLAGPKGQPFRLRQRRRMVSGDLHYLDHPQFGVLAVINRAGE